MNNPAVVTWLLDAATLIGFALLTACMAYGLVLLIAPDWALRVSGQLNRRFSGRKALRPLEVPRESERFFYRHHRVVGGLLLTGVVVFFLFYFLDFPRGTVLVRLAASVGSPFAGVMMDSLEGFLVGMNVLIGILATVMVFRPSLLKPVEATANRWISTRRLFRHADENHQPLDRFVERFPRLTGLLVLLTSTFVFVGFLIAMG